MKNVYSFVVLILALDASAVIFPSIPNHLIPCYRSDGPNITAPYRLDVFLSTLRTLEKNTQLDLRLFTTSLLRSLRLDGIERGFDGIETTFVTPYHASSFQFHKYKILMDIFLPSQNLNLVEDIEASLSVGERCILHKMLSSTVSYRERGDESVVCPEVIMPTQTPRTNNSTRSNSRCPIENGVIQTDWGTISIGTIVGAIAATMESQRVLVSDILNADLFRSSLAEELTDTKFTYDIETSNVPNIVEETTQTGAVGISNIWVATLAGDLSEVVVNQGPRVGFRTSKVFLGGASRWNDTMLPRNYYMLNHTNGLINWQITDAEILAGIDGLILSQYVPNWIEQRESLRLSQIIDMYYSNDGVSFNPKVKACNRESLFAEVLDLNVLYKEVKDFSRILILRQGSVYIPPETLNDIAVIVVDAFIEYYPSLLKRYNKECGVNNDITMMDLIVTTDGSWMGYDVEQFTSWLGDVSEVGVSGSNVSLLHGSTGTWVVPPASNLTIFYEHVRNYTGDWPTRLNLPNILSFLMRHLQNKTIAEADNQLSVVPSTIVLIVSPSDRLSETETARAKDLMNSLRTTYFDVYFDYISQDLTGFKEISGGFYDYSELFLQVPSAAVSDIITGVKEQIISKQVPKSIVGAHCNYNYTVFTQVPYEDFVQPNKTNVYRIHSYYLQQQPSIHIQIQNNIQGVLKVCSWRGSEREGNCNVLELNQADTVTLTNPCLSQEFCPPAHISITGVTSNNMCANNDCRYPHSISYNIQHSGLRCLQLRGNSNINSPVFTFYILIAVIIIILC